jgi:hypothetical protein
VTTIYSKPGMQVRLAALTARREEADRRWLKRNQRKLKPLSAKAQAIVNAFREKHGIHGSPADPLEGTRCSKPVSQASQGRHAEAEVRGAVMTTQQQPVLSQRDGLQFILMRYDTCEGMAPGVWQVVKDMQRHQAWLQHVHDAKLKHSNTQHTH